MIRIRPVAFHCFLPLLAFASHCFLLFMLSPPFREGKQKADREQEAHQLAARFCRAQSSSIFGVVKIERPFDEGDRILSDSNHEASLGKIVLGLAPHEVGDYGHGSISDPVMTLIDRGRPAHDVPEALAKLSEPQAAGIVVQLECRG